MPPVPRDDPFALRPGQAEAVRAIGSALEGGSRTVFLDAPVGSGKSLIHLLAARASLGGYLSTPQVILVNQYGDDTRPGGKFEGLAETLYGRRNYPCTYLRTLPPEEGGRPYASAAGAPCTYLPGWPRECPAYAECDYYAAKAAAQAHPQTVTTMAYLLTALRFGLDRPASGWRERPLLVIDEAHNLADELVRFFRAELGPATLPGFRKAWLDSPADPRFKVIEALPAYVERLQEVLRPLLDRPTFPRRLRERIARLKSAIDAADDLLGKLRSGTVEWVHSFDPRRAKHVWRALPVRNLVAPFWDRFHGILLGSATFFGVEALVRDAGLPTPVARVVVPDTFAADRAPVRLLSAARLVYRCDPLEIERAADAVAAVASAHPAERGVVHANSYYLANAIRAHLPAEVRRRLTAHDALNRISRYDRWRHDPSPNAVFLAVAMSQGIDLVGALARWQVIVKVPFPNLGDVWVRRRREQADGEAWYAARTITDVLQACGRIMRAADDHGTTYVVDTQLDGLLDHGWADLPEWFRRRVEAGRSVRRPLPGKFGDYATRARAAPR